MSDTTDLVVISKESALQVFSTEKGLDPFMAKIRAEIDSFVPDVSTKKGRDAIASIAFKVAKSKTYLDGVGKDLVAELKELPKKIDASRKEMRDTLDAWKDEVRQPLTVWEQAEADRIKAHQDAIEAIATLGTDLDGLSYDALKSSIDKVSAVELGDTWQEFAALAGTVKDKALAALTKAIDARIKYDAEQAELAERQRQADEQAEIERQASLREKDKAHKAAINNAALAAFIAGGMTEECAKLAVTLIAKRAIPNIAISY